MFNPVIKLLDAVDGVDLNLLKLTTIKQCGFFLHYASLL